jgi:hypothetical protein
MAPDPVELSKRVDHLELTCGELERENKELTTSMHEFMLAQVKSGTEIAGYVKNAAGDIAEIKESVKSDRELLTQEISDRKVADTAHEGAMKTLKVDLTGKIRNAGYAKVVALLSSAALIAFTAFLRFFS